MSSDKSSKTNKYNGNKISLYIGLFHENRKFKRILESIIRKNPDHETFKKKSITLIEDDDYLDLNISQEYLDNTLLENQYETAHIPLGLNKLKFENNLYKEIIIDLFQNKEVFTAYRKIYKLNLFDHLYYKKEYNYNLSVPAILHYIYRGNDEGKNPSSYFDGNFYKEYNKYAQKSDLNPLVYFVLKGMDEGIIKINKNFYEPKAINRLTLNSKIDEDTEYGLNKQKRQKRIIVSFTSYPLRMNEIKYMIYSIIKQEFKADKIILWLSNEEFPNKEKDIPDDVLRFKEFGLEIRWCKNIYSYKKLIPTLKEFPNDIIVTADDDIFYPQNWLKKLYEHHLKYPKEIIVHRARKMIFKNHKEFTDYVTWQLITDESDASYLTFMTGAGGILYPPHVLSNEVFNEDKFMDLCKYGDDIWFWAMAIINHRKFRVVKDCFYDLVYINPAREVLLKEETLWLKNRKGSNDKQIHNMLKAYPEILDIIQEED